jgi:hypothetical protein
VEPDEQRRLEARFRSLEDAELRRITALEREQYRDDAFALATDEMARRRLPVLSPEEYWAQFREEWLAQVGFCFPCWATTTDELLVGAPPRGRLIGTRLVEGGDPCPVCRSVVATECFCVVVPIVRFGRYRVIFDRGFAPDPPRGRKLRDGTVSV